MQQPTTEYIQMNQNVKSSSNIDHFPFKFEFLQTGLRAEQDLLTTPDAEQ